MRTPTEEEILRAVTEDLVVGFDNSGKIFQRVVSPKKLARFLAEHLKN